MAARTQSPCLLPAPGTCWGCASSVVGSHSPREQPHPSKNKQHHRTKAIRWKVWPLAPFFLQGLMFGTIELPFCALPLSHRDHQGKLPWFLQAGRGKGSLRGES